MLIDTSQEYVCRVNGVPLFYNITSNYKSSYHQDIYRTYATPSPPYDSLMSSKIDSPPQTLSSPSLITLTPPLSPFNSSNASTAGTDQSRRRDSVIMKVENCQITPANDTKQSISIDHVCRWENCYR